jgi:AraC-like DNA-binding protein
MQVERQEHARGLIDVQAQARHRIFYRLDSDGLVSKVSARAFCSGNMATGQTALLPAGLSMNWRVGYRFICLCVSIDEAAFSAFACAHAAEPNCALLEPPPRTDSAFEHWVDMLSLEAQSLDAIAGGVKLSALALDTLLGMLKLLLLRRYGGNAEPSSDRLIQAQLDSYIEQHMSEQITVDHLAEAVGMNVVQLSRWMQNQLGHLPKRFLTDARMRRARALLEHSTQSVLEIALSTGFATHAHFSTTFRETFGVTPSQFRAQRSK